MVEKKKIIVREINQERFKEIKEEENLEENIEGEENEGGEGFVEFFSEAKGKAPTLEASPRTDENLERTAETAPSTASSVNEPLRTTEYSTAGDYGEKNYDIEKANKIKPTTSLGEERAREVIPRRMDESWQTREGIRDESLGAWREVENPVETNYKTVENNIIKDRKMSATKRRRII